MSTRRSTVSDFAASGNTNGKRAFAFVRQSILCACACLLFAPFAVARVTEVRIEVASGVKPRVTVELSELPAARRWTFVDAHGAAANLQARIGDFAAFDAHGAAIPTGRSENGDHEIAGVPASLRYDVDLAAPRDPASIANVSWLDAERGVLMLYDLLPRSVARARVNIVLPAKWRSFTTEIERADRFDIAAIDDAVFVIGRELREQTMQLGGVEFVLVTQGAWAFSDDDALAAIKQIYEAHRKVLPVVPRARVLVSLASFPHRVPADQWRAEARGATLNYFAGRLPSRVLALTRLTIALAHELLHLWTPNSLALTGSYGWFYEGFVEYQSLRLCVRLGIVSYQDFLDAVGRAYDRHLAARQRDPALSLIDAARRRRTSDATIYSDGLLTAFVYDLTLRHKTTNKRSLDDVFRELLREHVAGNTPRDGSDAVVAVLDRVLGSTNFTERFVSTSHTIDLTNHAANFGLHLDRTGARTRLGVAPDLTKQQHALHHELARTY